MRGVQPIRVPARVQHAKPKPPPVPVQTILDEHAALQESVAPPSPEQLLESGEELSFLREGLPRSVLRKLRRGHWVVQAEFDLHGMTCAEAHAALSAFVSESVRKGRRCLRIIHGKGLRSPGREPVLKAKVKGWLARREDVLAFCQAPDTLGGSGALLVLLVA